MFKQQKIKQLQYLSEFLETQLREEELKEEYQQRTLNQMRSYRMQLTSTSNQSKIQQKEAHKFSQRKKEESGDIMSQSKMSIELNNSRKMIVQRRSSQKEQRGIIDFEMEYQQYCKEIVRHMSSITGKDRTSGLKKSLILGKNNSVVGPRGSVTARNDSFRREGSILLQSRKLQTPKKVELSAKQKILQQLGDSCLIVSNDEVVSNLIKHLREEEIRYVDGTIKASELDIAKKMKNYMERLSQKNQQVLFKLKQQSVDRSLAKTQGNRQTVKRGYTIRMKQLIEEGMRGRSVLNNP